MSGDVTCKNKKKRSSFFPHKRKPAGWDMNSPSICHLFALSLPEFCGEFPARVYGNSIALSKESHAKY